MLFVAVVEKRSGPPTGGIPEAGKGEANDIVTKFRSRRGKPTRQDLRLWAVRRNRRIPYMQKVLSRRLGLQEAIFVSNFAETIQPEEANKVNMPNPPASVLLLAPAESVRRG